MKEIYHRLSVRKYQDRPIEEEKLTELMKAAMQAPSAENQQPWEFYLVTDPEKKAALSVVHPWVGFAKDAPVVIVPVYRTELPAPALAQIDLALAMENLWLTADELGLGGVFCAIAPYEHLMEKVAEILDLPEDLKAYCIFPVGYPAEEREQPLRYDESRVHRV